MEKRIIVLGAIGNTEFQNNDRAKVMYRYGISKTIYAGVFHSIAPMVIKQYGKQDNYTRSDRNDSTPESR